MKKTISVYDPHRHEILFETIKYIEGQGNYSVLHLTNSRPIILSRTVLKLQGQLPSFVRIHKKYLVNPQFIAPTGLPSLKDLTLTLTTGEVLTVSKRRIPHIALMLT